MDIKQIIEEQRSVFGNYYPLRQDIKLDIALYSYYMANGTYCLKILNSGNNKDYRKELEVV